MKRTPLFPVSRQRRRGSVLIVVLVVCLGLVSLTLVFGHAMFMAYRGEDNALAGRQADAAINGAEQYAEVVLGNVVTTQSLPVGTFPDPATYQHAAVPVGDAFFWFVGVPGPSDPVDVPTFGLVDEASKLNLNSATVPMLLNLPGMTADLAQAIVQWRTTPGASTDGSSSVSVGTVKGAPFESPSELELVNGGTDPSVLYGDDTNLNHISDPEENTLTSLGQFNPGLLEYVTVFSRESNTLSDGTQRVNITNGSTRNQTAIQQLLTQTISSSRAGQIMAALKNAGTVRSVLEFYRKSGMSAAELDQITPKITMKGGTYAVGLINVNTASAAVLACVPGITPDIANNIVAARTTPTAGVTTNLAWVAPILGSALAQAGPYLTAQSYQVSADVAAVGRFGRGYRRTLFVLDNSSGTPQIVYRRNLAALGWALGKDARTALAAQATAQTTGAPPPHENAPFFRCDRPPAHRRATRRRRDPQTRAGAQRAGVDAGGRAGARRAGAAFGRRREQRRGRQPRGRRRG